MSRYSGPRVKVQRAVGVDLPGLSAKSREKRPYPPGQHGHARRKLSEYAVRLLETKKVRLNYGVTEGQLRRLVVEAHSQPTSTTALLQFLERRLDNVIFRAGFAKTIPAARQLVNHGHVLVNDRRTDIASFRIVQGQRIVLTLSKLPLPDPRFPSPEWLEVDRDNATIKVIGLPDGEQTLFPVDMKLIIEHYAIRL